MKLAIMSWKLVVVTLLAMLIAGSSSLLARGVSSGLRGTTPLDEEGPAPLITPQRNTAGRELRNSRR
jgi:nitrate reductase (cytochrome), electron transfer subunit